MNKKQTRIDEWHYICFSLSFFLSFFLSTPAVLTTTQNLHIYLQPYKMEDEIYEDTAAFLFLDSQCFPGTLACLLCSTFTFPSAPDERVYSKFTSV